MLPMVMRDSSQRRLRLPFCRLTVLSSLIVRNSAELLKKRLPERSDASTYEYSRPVSRVVRI